MRHRKVEDALWSLVATFGHVCKMTVNKALQVLGLEVGATEAEIRQAYRDHIQVWHPDKHANNPRVQKLAEEKTKEINLAFETLRAVSFQTKSWKFADDDADFGQPTTESPTYEKDPEGFYREEEYDLTQKERRGVTTTTKNDSVVGAAILGCVIGSLFAGGWDGAIPGAIIGYFVGRIAIRRQFVSSIISAICGCACLIIAIVVVFWLISLMFNK